MKSLIEILKFFGPTLGMFSIAVFIMAIPVVEFSREGYKIRKVFG